MTATALATAQRGLTPHGMPDAAPWRSFTKTVLAAAFLRLPDQGALQLPDHVDRQRFTVGRLLRHEAGLPKYGSIGRYHEDVSAE